MTPSRAAVVLGASGSVGHALVEELIRSGAFRMIATIVRRPQPESVRAAGESGVALRETVLPDMAPDSVAAATESTCRALEDEVIVGCSVLGVGANTAKLTIDQHRAVDVRLNAAFARGLKASGRVSHLAFMSSVGADPNASTGGSGAAGSSRYLRVKGESEEAVKAAGPTVVSLFRPAMIIGSQHTPWVLEKVLPLFSFATPGRFRSITVQQIARAMVATSIAPPSESRIYHFPEMITVARELP
ncbi:MAG TPA: NAD(P)H-binding protein [Luteitalea sp.]|nr:NAD(P)H-binding protein [Luteitalea sp.]